MVTVAILLLGSVVAPPARSASNAMDPVVLVAPGCAVAGVGAAARFLGPGCAAFGLGSPAAEEPVGTLPPSPCTSVIPLVDDRCETWVGERYDGPGHGFDGPGELGNSKVVASSPDGATAYTVAASDVSSSGDDYALATIARDATGVTKWVARFQGPPEASQLYPTSVVADPDGDLVYSAGGAFETGDECFRGNVVVAYDATTGAERWAYRSPGIGTTCQFLWTMKIDPTGERLVLVGSRSDPDGSTHFDVVTLDANTGQTLWTDDYTGDYSPGAYASALGFSPDGSRVYVAGTGLKPDPNFGGVPVAWAIVAYDTQTGAPVWTSRWDPPHPENSFPANAPAEVVASPDGARMFLVGGAEGKTLFDIFTVSFDTADGHKTWEADFEGLRSKLKSSFDSVWYTGALAVSGDSKSVYVAGYSTCIHGVNICADFETLAYDAVTGTLRWEARHTSEQWIHWVPCVAVSPDGKTVYVSGEARHFELITARYETLAYDAASGGVPKWTARYTDGYSFWSGMAMSPDGNRIFGTGDDRSLDQGQDSTTYDELTVAYAT